MNPSSTNPSPTNLSPVMPGTEAARVEFEQLLGIDVSPELLELALTHRSYAYEHGGLAHNERLEFLGDSILG